MWTGSSRRGVGPRHGLRPGPGPRPHRQRPPGVMAEKDGEKWAPPCREPLRALVMRLLTLECLRDSIQGKVASVNCPRLTGHAPKPQDQRGAAVSVGLSRLGDGGRMGRWDRDVLGGLGGAVGGRGGVRHVPWGQLQITFEHAGPRCRTGGTRRAARAGRGGEHRPRPGAWLHGADHWPGPLIREIITLRTRPVFDGRGRPARAR